MPVIMDMEQGSPEWYKARLGLPTASNFSKIVTSTGAKSKQAVGYMDELLGELETGTPTEHYSSQYMKEGQDKEPDARLYYEWITGNEVREVGFVVRDDGLTGCSPDGLVGDDGGVEIKSVIPKTQIARRRAGKLPSEYVVQVQGCMWICERRWWDFISYHPDMRHFLIRIERDEKLIAKIEEHVLAFAKELRIQQKMLERGVA